MKRLALPFLAALAVGTALAGAKFWRPTESPPKAEFVPVVVEPDEMDLNTGDTFWGMSLDGVIPCSSMIVKGGGHLVSLSRNTQTDRKLYFHVRGTKEIELDGRTFRMTVTGDDTVHVDRRPTGELAASVEQPAG